MGLRGEAAIVGYTDRAATKRPTGPLESTLEQWARLAAATLADAGLPATAVDGICTGHLQEAAIFAPATIAEYLGMKMNFAEMVSSKSLTAHSDRTVPTPASPRSTAPPTATTSGQSPRSPSTSGSTPTTIPGRSSMTCPSLSTTSSTARSSTPPCTCWRLSCRSWAVPVCW